MEKPSLEDLCRAIDANDREGALRVLQTNPFEEGNGRKRVLPCGVFTEVARKGWSDVVKRFLQYGASVDDVETPAAKDGVSSTVLDRALVDAAFEGDNQALMTLFAAGLDVNHVDADGWTLLARAVTSSVELTECLLDHGADPDLAISDGWTPLMLAADVYANPFPERQEKILRLLLAKGANVGVRTSEGKTVFDLVAQQKGNPDVIHRLLEVLRSGL